MIFHMNSIERALPPLLALPVELKSEIISHIPNDEYPSLACLRRTHPSFLDLIPRAHILSKLSDTELSNRLLKIELEYAYLLPHGHYPCYFCARVLPLDAFAIGPARYIGDVDERPDSSTRSCKDCYSLKKSFYRRSFIESLIWIGTKLEKLPMPPSRPRLRPLAGATVTLMTDDLMQHIRNLKQQAQDHGTVAEGGRGPNGANEARSPNVGSHR